MTDETPAAEPVEAAKSESRIVKWVGNFVLGGSVIAFLIVFVAATLARFDIIDKLTGFIPFAMALNPARALVVIGVLGLIFAVVRKVRLSKKLLAGTALSAAIAIAIYTMLIIPAGKVPPIHDITTRPDNPPQFTALDVDELSTGPFSAEEWRAFHDGAYSDVQPIVISAPPEEVLASAQALAEDRGWEIASYDAEAGRLEATATAGYVRFYDDVIIEVTPIADGSTRVDMRSVSRVGVSDVGYNAARIRDFLADMPRG